MLMSITWRPSASRRLPTTRSPRRAGPPRGSGRLTAIAVVVGLLIAGGASEAQATPSLNPDRVTLPVIAGTKLTSDGKSCTAGAILSYTPYQYLPASSKLRSMRYAVTAKHCFKKNDVVSVGGIPVGRVISEAAGADLELVEIEPSLDSREALRCAQHGSHAAFCRTPEWIPNARGQVFMTRSGRVQRVNVTGTADTPTDRFCTSGFASGVQCSWYQSTRHPLPRPTFENPATLRVAESHDFGATSAGDSGGPILSYEAQLIGINSQQTMGGAILFYLPMSQVFRNFRFYQLAAGS